MEISNGILTATINPLGAELTSLKDNNREYIWEGDPKYWGKHAPILFPIVGCLKNNTYLYEGKIYALTRHGFARDNVFNIEQETQDSVVFVLGANTDTKIMYPFDFELKVSYTLKGKSLETAFTVTNKGDKKMIFCIGGHPAFALNEKLGNYSLKFEKEEELVSNQLVENLVSAQTVMHKADKGILPLDYDLFENDALVFTQIQSRAVELRENGTALLKVSFEKFPHLGIWTKDKAPFICIEPWQGFSDAPESTGNLTEKPGTVTLLPGEEYSAGFTIEILR